MNYRLVCRFLGVISMLIAVTMLFSLPWAYPSWGTRLAIDLPESGFESSGFYALCESILICAAVGLLLIGIGGRPKGVLYHKEAMAVVGFAWILATILGGLPFYLSGTYRGPSVRIASGGRHLFVHEGRWLRPTQRRWRPPLKISRISWRTP